MNDSISFYPVDNGDTIMIKIGDIKILTDVHYRAPDNTGDIFDVKRQIKADCGNKILDYFILTHPHDDHLRGFGEIFHYGSPADCPKDKILVKTIICTEYAATLEKPTDVALTLIKEIKRRKKFLDGTPEDGNKLFILKESHTIKIANNFSGIVLSPSDIELKAAQKDGGNINNTSLCIMWTYEKEHNILLGGDSENEVWKRLHEKYDSSKLTWQLCEASHHCSFSVFASKDTNNSYIEEKDAFTALSHVDGSGFVIASSKEIKRNEDNPPSYKAKNKWIKILEKKNVGNASSRFLCTADSKNKDGNRIPIMFYLDKKGVRLKKTSLEEVKLIASAGFGSPVKYGV